MIEKNLILNEGTLVNEKNKFKFIPEPKLDSNQKNDKEKIETLKEIVE